jgi:hypothetical protein
LRQVQLLGGAGVIQVARHRFKDLELAQRQVHSDVPELTIYKSLS